MRIAITSHGAFDVGENFYQRILLGDRLEANRPHVQVVKDVLTPMRGGGALQNGGIRLAHQSPQCFRQRRPPLSGIARRLTFNELTHFRYEWITHTHIPPGYAYDGFDLVLIVRYDECCPQVSKA